MKGTEQQVTTTHESLILTPWDTGEGGGVSVAHVDDPGQPIMLFRNAAEVQKIVGAFIAATDPMTLVGLMAANVMDSLNDAETPES